MLNNLFVTRLAYLIGFVVSFGLVALALIIQTRYHLEPCPLCISQRIIFMVVGVLFLVAAIQNSSKVFFVKAYALLQMAVALGGAGVAIRHWWLQVHKDQMLVDCGVGFDYMFENFPLQKALTLVFKGTGDCAAIDWTLLGFTIPQLALISFVSLVVYAALVAKARLKS
jgi:protein dithiol:quinone oxidoreductase